MLIDGLPVDLVVLRMGADVVHPCNSGLVLHLNNQSVLVATHVEKNPVVAANAGICKLLFH